MRKIFFSVAILLIGPFFLFTPRVYAQSEEHADEFFTATVVEVVAQGEKEIMVGMRVLYQTVKLRIRDGEQKGEEITVNQGEVYSLTKEKILAVGEVVLVDIIIGPDGTAQYHIADRYRLDSMFWIVAVFVLLVLLMSGWRGIGSLVGLVMSFAIITGYIVPQIINGSDPLVIALVGSLAIMVTTIYLAHGFSRQTTYAVVSTGITLALSVGISYLFVSVSRLSGLGTEDAYSLKLGNLGSINFKGLLLGGMILGTLGVLDDITTSQTAAVAELSSANRKFGPRELVRRGLRVGREHIASLVNTLVLAYAGVSLPLFLFFVLNPGNQPLWVWLNTEFIAEEVIRTLVGSTSLILAVPISTYIAAMMYGRAQKA